MCRHKCNPLLIAQQTNNAQNIQHKLRVVFSYLERNKQNQEPWLLTEQINRFVKFTSFSLKHSTRLQKTIILKLFYDTASSEEKRLFSPRGVLKEFLDGMCRWDPGTLNLYPGGVRHEIRPIRMRQL